MLDSCYTCTNIKCQEGDFHFKHDYFCLFILNCSKELWRCSLDGATHKMAVESLEIFFLNNYTLLGVEISL